MVERKRIDIRVPLVNENLQENENSKEIIESLMDDSQQIDLCVHVHSKEMIATAIALSMSKRHNVEYYAEISDFPGNEYIHGYLLSGYFKHVEMV